MSGKKNGPEKWRGYLQTAALVLLTGCALLLTYSLLSDNAAMGAATSPSASVPQSAPQSGQQPAQPSRHLGFEAACGPCALKPMLYQAPRKSKAPGPVLTSGATSTFTRTRTPTVTGTPPTATNTFPGPIPTSHATSTATRSRTATRTGTPPTATSTPCGGPRPWQYAAPMPTGLADYAFAQDSNSFYVISGVTNGYPINSVRRYDLSTNTWITLASIPYGNPGLEATLYNGKIYVAGGYYYSGYSFQIYDVASNIWSLGPPLPADSYGAGIGAYGGNIYVVGGGYYPSSTTTQIYNIASNSWSVGETLPSPFSYGGYTQVGQYLYLVGGYGYNYLKGHEVEKPIDPRAISNRRKLAPYANSVATQRLDLSTGEWSSGPVFAQGRADVGLASDGFKLYAMGGDLPGGSYSDPSDQVDELPLTNWPLGSWVPSPANLPSPRLGNKAGFFSSAFLGGEIWSTGGSEASYTSLADNLFRIADPCASPTLTPTGTQLTATVTRTRTNTPTVTATVCGSSGGYTYVQSTGGIESGTTDTGNHCGDCATYINFPFTYQFYGTGFNSAYVSSKGVLEFNGSSSAWNNTCSPSPFFYNAIMAYWDDLRTDCGGCGVYTSVTGSAPNRVFNIEWRANYFSFGGVANFEIQLYEGQSGAGGRFDLIYGQVDQEGSSATVAVQKDTGSLYTLYECNIGGLTPGLALIFTQPPCGTYTPTRTGTPPTATITRTRTMTPTATATVCTITINDAITTSDPVQFGLLYRSYPSACGFAQSCPGYYDNNFHHYDAYSFTNTNSYVTCITVDFSDTCYSYLTSYAYLNSYDPNDICGNYVAQSATYSNTGSYSFYVPAGATFVVVMAETYPNVGCGSYTMNVSGLTCATPTPTNTPCNPSCTPTPTRTATIAPTSTPTPCGPDSNYVYTQSNGASIVPGTSLVPGSQCDDCSSTITLPFTYYFYGQPYTTAYASDNGSLAFAPGNTPFANSCLPYPPVSNVIFPHWDDTLTFGGSCSSYPDGCGIYTSVSGTAPNRIFNVEWRAVYFSTAAIVNFEVQLYENPALARFDMVYGTVTNGGVSATVGVQRDTGSLSTQYECNTGGLTSGLQLTFTQPTCATPTPTATQCSPSCTPTRTSTPTFTRTRTSTPTVTPTFCGALGSYTYTQSTGEIEPGTTDAGLHCVDCSTPVFLPFSYSLYDQTFGSAYVSDKGVLQFNSNSNAYSNTCAPTTFFNYAIMAHWDDMRTDCAGCGVYTSVMGSAPDRVFNIEWRANYYNGSGSANFEIQLYENQNRFDLVYGQLGEQGSGATVAVQRDTGSRYTLYECNTGGLTPGLRLSFTQMPCGGTFTPTPTPTQCSPSCTSTPTYTRTRTRTVTPTATATCVLGNWSRQAPYPIPVMDNAVASQGGFIYSFSGVSNGPLVTNSYKYSATTNSWTSIAPLPAVREQASAVSDGAYIYILGGADDLGDNTTTNYRYDPVNNTYTTMAPFTVATWAQAAAYINGKIYKIAGCDVNCNSSFSTVEAYDIASNTWTTVAPLPESLGWLMATAIGNYIYTAGGVVPFESTKTYRYDPAANNWDDSAIVDMPTPRWGAASDILDGKWLLAGGYENSAVSNSAILWNPASNTWSYITPMLQARARMSGATLSALSFYAVGGRSSTGGFSGTTENQRYGGVPCTTPTPTSGGVINGHLTWQSIGQPNANNTVVTGTLILCAGSTPHSYTFHTDQNGNFSVSSGLPDGAYGWRVSGPRHLATSGTLTISGGSVTVEFGNQRAGDTDASNIVNAVDFNAVKRNFGQAGELPTDFNFDQLTNALDFNTLKTNFGQGGAALTCP